MCSLHVATGGDYLYGWETYFWLSNPCLIAADEGTSNYKLFKAANAVSMVAAPLALVNVGSDIMAFDYVLCASLPITFHIGANWVITDYVRVFANVLFVLRRYLCSDVSRARYFIRFFVCVQIANVNPSAGNAARIAMVLLSLGAAAGLTKMCVKGDGIAAPIASLWTYKKK